MDLRKIKKLIELVEESGISELEVKSGDEAVRIARPAAPAVAVNAVSSSAPATLPVPAMEKAVPAEPAVVNPPPARANKPMRTIHAPMAGTFYAAAEPGAEPFVRVGMQVQAGQVLCIIESMKMMNEISAEYAGECVELLVENAEPVAAGQALLRLS